MNAAVAYLVLACGTGADNRTTSWSAHAIERHTGIGRDRAPRAIAALKDAGLVAQIKNGRGPRYTLSPAYAVPGSATYLADPDAEFVKSFRPKLVWLSNRLVTGDDWEGVSLLEALRRTQNVPVLRLLIHLYGDLRFTKESGLEWREGGLRQFYDRTVLGKAGGRVVWGFKPAKSLSIDPDGFPARYGDTFEAAFAVLLALDVVAMVPHLVETTGYDGEVIHSLADQRYGMDSEARIHEEALATSQSLLAPEAIATAEGNGFTRFVPLGPALDKIQVFGIARLACPPAARLSLEWAAGNSDDWRNHARAYEQARPAISRSASRSGSTS